MIRASKGSDIIIRALYSSANCGPNSRGSKNAYILVETHWILRGVREACMWNTRESEWVSERKREIGDSFLSSSQRIFLSKLEKLVITVSVSISFFFLEECVTIFVRFKICRSNILPSWLMDFRFLLILNRTVDKCHDIFSISHS